MCGRYALALRPSQVRQALLDDEMRVDDAPDDEGDGAPRQSYNFAPGYHGVIYRADVPDWGSGPTRESKSGKVKKVDEEEPVEGEESSTVRAETNPANGEATDQNYKLQGMDWGLIPFWTKRSPDYGAVMKTINCRDDSLAHTGGIWASMKGRKRCVAIAQGFYEWLKMGKEKVPHFVKRKDGKLMLMAGLWDCVKYEDNDAKNYTYTIITTSSNDQLRFLHDRMPVILNPRSEELRTWLDPARHEWSADLQELLKPFDGKLEVYPVSKEVGKVGNNSPSFIVPIASRENKSNIANFFAKAQAKKTKESSREGEEVKKEDSAPAWEEKGIDEIVGDADDRDTGAASISCGRKRKGDGELCDEVPPQKREEIAAGDTAVKAPPTPSPKKPFGRRPQTISATSIPTKSHHAKSKGTGSQKITRIFRNRA